MAKIVNNSSRTLTVAATGDVCEPGASIDVPSDLAKSLCEQGDVWIKPTKTSAAGEEDNQ